MKKLWPKPFVATESAAGGHSGHAGGAAHAWTNQSAGADLIILVSSAGFC